MTTLSELGGGGVKSVQSGTVDVVTASISSGSAPEATYYDKTLVTALTDYTKAVVHHEVAWGMHGTTDANAQADARSSIRAGTPTGLAAGKAKARLVNNTTLRFYTNYTAANSAFSGPYTVVEYN